MYSVLVVVTVAVTALLSPVCESCGDSLYDDESWFSPAHNRQTVKLSRQERSPIPDIERLNCSPGDTPPPNRVNTTARIDALRKQMLIFGLNAYIIVNEKEKRRDYISGFAGSAGTAVVTSDEAALWTDGRYWLQAEDQLDCHWTLMRENEDMVPSQLEWLAEKFGNGSRVGADPSLISADKWIEKAEKLNESGIEFVAKEQNLIDLIRPEDNKTTSENITIYPLELKFAGKTWQDKVSEIRSELKKLEADMLIVTTLEEVAWLLNLRAKVASFTPVFDSFVIVGKEEVELYLKLNNTVDIEDHLNVHGCAQNQCVILKEYGTIYNRLRSLKDDKTVQKVLLPKKRTYGPGASFAIYNAVPASKRLVKESPALILKGQKNPIEIQGMKNSHIRDAVALCDFLAFLEKEIKNGSEYDELSAATLLAEYRGQQEHFVSLSFGSISSFGKNGALNHYNPTIDTTQKITNESTYLLDSGGQYKDGTTDVTRTMHYGKPTAYQIETYTRVLMGAIDLARLVFPEGVGDDDVDVLTRQHLYEVGLDYHHGTGHGIGMFLNVHEDPILIGNSGRDNHEFKVGHFFSDEPGYYKDGEFGIRLETILHVVEKKVPYFFKKKTLAFESVTLVPFEAKMINSTLLEPKQCRYLNDYHQQVLSIVGTEMQKQGREKGYQWLQEKTKHIDCY